MKPPNSSSSISKLRAARNVCLVHLSQHQAAVGAACKVTSTRTCKERNASSTQRSSGWRRSARLIVNPDEHGLVDKDRKKEEAASASFS
jgi:hypothetical protein